MPPLTQEHKDAISRGQEERHRRQYEETGGAQPDQKKCTKCGEWKPIDQYSLSSRRLKSGEMRRYPSSQCKKCSRARAEEWKQRFIAEHGEEAWKVKFKQWNSKRDPVEKQRYDRDYQRMQRRLAGIEERGPWVKYKDEIVEQEGQIRVPNGPFAEWWEGLAPLTKARACNEDENLRRTVTRIIHEQQNVDYWTVDYIGTLVGQPGIARTLYPGIESD